MKRYRFDAASFPTKEDVGMPKKYDAGTQERALRMFDEQAGEYASVTAACGAVAGRLGLPTLPVSRAAMVPAPATTLFGEQGSASLRRPVGAAPRVLRTSSAMLYDALAGVYADLGFDARGDEVFRDLVAARVVEPTSLLDVDRVLATSGASRRACRRGS